MKRHIKALYRSWQMEQMEYLPNELSILSEDERYAYRKNEYIFLFDDICRLGGNPCVSLGFMADDNESTRQRVTNILKSEGFQNEDILAFCNYLSKLDSLIINELKNTSGDISRSAIIWLSAILVLSEDELYGHNNSESFNDLLKRMKKVADDQLSRAGYSMFDLKNCVDMYIALSVYLKFVPTAIDMKV